MVELNVAGLGAAEGGLELELLGADGNSVASARIDRSAIRDRWATFCLPPQTGSKGMRYAAVLRAPSADAASPLRRCEYSLDASGWVPLEAADGVIDSQHEKFVLSLDKLTPGEHLVVVRVVDSASNTGLAKVVLR